MNEVTPECSGASQLACNIINATFMSLDGFEPLRKQMDQSVDYPAVAFAAELARIVDREIKKDKDRRYQEILEYVGKAAGMSEEPIKIMKMTDEELAS